MSSTQRNILRVKKENSQVIGNEKLLEYKSDEYIKKKEVKEDVYPPMFVQDSVD